MASADFVQKVAEYLLAPFQSWDVFVRSSAGGITAVTDLSSKTAWPYLLSSIFAAWLVYQVGRRRGLVGRGISFQTFLFPADVYRQRSAIVDYKFVAIDLSIKAFAYTPLVTGLSWLVYKLVQPHFTSLVMLEMASVPPPPAVSCSPCWRFCWRTSASSSPTTLCTGSRFSGSFTRSITQRRC